MVKQLLLIVSVICIALILLMFTGDLDDDSLYLAYNQVSGPRVVEQQIKQRTIRTQALIASVDGTIPQYVGNRMRLIFPMTEYNNVRLTSYQKADRVHPITGILQGHKGTDFANNRASTILSATDGVVVLSIDQPGVLANSLGIITVKSTMPGGGNIYFRYLHIKHGSAVVKKGDQVRAGDPLATEGSTGRSTARHLHFEILPKQSGCSYDETYAVLDPEKFAYVTYDGGQPSVNYTANTSGNIKGGFLKVPWLEE